MNSEVLYTGMCMCLECSLARHQTMFSIQPMRIRIHPGATQRIQDVLCLIHKWDLYNICISNLEETLC